MGRWTNGSWVLMGRGLHLSLQFRSSDRNGMRPTSRMRDSSPKYFSTFRSWNSHTPGQLSSPDSKLPNWKCSKIQNDKGSQQPNDDSSSSDRSLRGSREEPPPPGGGGARILSMREEQQPTQHVSNTQILSNPGALPSMSTKRMLRKVTLLTLGHTAN